MITNNKPTVGLFAEILKRNFVIEQLEGMKITTHEGESIYNMSYGDLRRLLAIKKFVAY